MNTSGILSSSKTNASSVSLNLKFSDPKLAEDSYRYKNAAGDRKRPAGNDSIWPKEDPHAPSSSLRQYKYTPHNSEHINPTNNAPSTHGLTNLGIST
ncbi:hypothetical protein, partial [Pseudomonas fluorescens]|uniref:hypothetical protein n=1 Tax=Pseudomonas fluorescens TaxID=294 RepID=UPI001F36E6F5